MNKQKYIYLFVLIHCFAASCLFSGKEKLPHYYKTPQWNAYDLRRVVILPFWDDVHGEQNDASQALTAAFVQEMRKQAPFEVIELSEEDAQEIKSKNPFRQGHYPLDSLIAVGRRWRADAVVFGSVISHRPYVPQSLGTRAEMAAIDTGETLWWVDALYDASDADVENSVQRYYIRQSSHYSGTDDWRTILSSPNRFAGFVASQCVNTIWPGK